jgi:predicted nucleotidyltransferase
MLTINEIKEFITPVVKKYPVDKVILFGSYARGDASEASDIDLVVDSNGRLHNRKIFALGGELLDVLPVRVDVYDVSEIPNHSGMYENIFLDGITIYES